MRFRGLRIVVIAALAGTFVFLGMRAWLVDADPEFLAPTAPSSGGDDPTGAIARRPETTAATPSTAVPPAAGPGERPAVELLVRLRESSGRTTSMTRGRLLLAWDRGDDGETTVELAVVDGRALLDLAPDLAGLRVVSGRCTGETRDLFPKDPRRIGRDELTAGPVLLVLACPPRFALHVLDAGDRRPLAEAAAIPLGGPQGGRRPLVLDLDAAPFRGPSPLVVDDQAALGQAQRWLVVAPDHAATLVVLDAEREGDRYVLLEAGGGIRITVQGDFRDLDPDRRPMLRLRPREDRAWLADEFRYPVGEQVLTDEATILVLGLRPGDFEVSAECGPAGRPMEGAVVGRAPVTVVAGTIRPVLLKVDSTPLRVPLAEVSGRIILPDDGEPPRKRRIEIRTAGSKARVQSRTFAIESRGIEGESRRQAFGPLRLEPGDYVASIEGQSFDFVVEEDGTKDLEFRLEPRESVEIAFERPGAALSLAGDRLLWSAGGAHGEGIWNEERRAFLVSPAAGPIHLTLFHGWAWFEFHQTRTEGQKRYTFELPVEQAFKVVFECDGRLVTCSDVFAVELRAPGQEEPIFVRRLASASDGMIRFVDAPGRYSLTVVHPPPGFLAGGPQEFEVRTGELTRVTVPLRLDR